MLRYAQRVGSNDCAIAAISAVSGVSAENALARCRAYDPDCVGPHRGVPVSVFIRVLNGLGFDTTEIGMRQRSAPRSDDALPLHKFLARLKGRRAVVVLHYPGSPKNSTHAVAAEDFMLCDNMHPRPQWYGSYLDECGFKSMPRVLHATIIEEGAKP